MGVEAWRQMPAESLAAIGYFRRENCSSCHMLGKSGPGPDLLVAPSSKPAEWLAQHIKQPAPNAPASTLNGLQVKTLATFVTRRGDKDVEAWISAPQADVEGAMVYNISQCGMCHELNGTGQKMGPPLNGLADHRARDWVQGHFAEPAKFSPGSTMPPYKFNSRDLDRITSYLLDIPK